MNRSRFVVLSLLATVGLASAAASQGPQLAPAVFKDLKWREIGPAIFGGRILDIEVARIRGQPDQIYLIAENGGVFKSTNGGLSWTPVFDGVNTMMSMGDIAKSVLIFLGVPLAAGALTRLVLVRARGRDWYDNTLMPRLAPTALLGLLYTIVLMFAMQGDRILALPIDVLRIALPMVVYFFVMFGLALVLSAKLGFGYEETASLSFTAAGNNFELAIAVAVATFGISSGEALAAVVGPLIEVPVLVGLVYVSLWARRRYFTTGELHALRADL